MKTIATAAFALLLNVSCLAAMTSVTGTVTGGKGMVVRLMTYSDQVSYLRETLDMAIIGEDEKFRLSVDISETIYAWIDIDFRKADIFLQPGQFYEVQLQADVNAISTSYYDRSSLPMKILVDDQDRLNAYISDFNELYNDFLLNYAENIRVKGSASAYNTFRAAIDMRFKNATNSYFRDYVRYKSASMEMFLRLKSRDKLGLEFMTGQPLLLNNIEYMDFFHLYFEKYFISGNKYFNFNKSWDLINEGASLEVMMDSLGADPVLKEDALKQLVLLSGLKELYNVKGFKRDRILSLIREVADSGSNEEIRQSASNLISRLGRLKRMTDAPAFTLPEVGGEKEYSLADFTGKYVYLVFFDSRNPASLAELSLITGLYEDYRNKVAFIAVSVDRSPPVISDNPNIPPGTWIVLHYDGNIELLENYDALSYPYFILINDQGKIVECPAPSPSENIQKAFDAI
jgi:thiol-disulfide isomerase/thioredoxin